MKWENLKKNKCPQCNKDFMKGLETNFVNKTHGCVKIFSHPCGFQISEDRFKEIVSSQVERDLSRGFGMDLL